MLATHRAAFLYGLAESLEAIPDLVPVFVAGKNNKLFTTEAGEPVGFPAEVFTHQASQCLQADIPRLVAVIIVDPLEMVGVHHRDGKARTVALAPLETLAEFLVEIASVAQLGQVVGNAQPGEGFVGVGQIPV